MYNFSIIIITHNIIIIYNVLSLYKYYGYYNMVFINIIMYMNFKNLTVSLKTCHHFHRRKLIALTTTLNIED